MLLDEEEKLSYNESTVDCGPVARHRKKKRAFQPAGSSLFWLLLKVWWRESGGAVSRILDFSVCLSKG
jgi:hypothetical protein